MASTSIIGFDSAWTDRATAPGALCVLRHDGISGWQWFEPKLVRFDDALEIIRAEKLVSRRCLVAIDQPTIVPNISGSRPADNAVASLISYIGGGVQPANRSKLGMFDDTAPIWRFKALLGASDDPELARTSADGVFLMEVFPALALASMRDSFHGRRLGPRYNPARRKTFRHADWVSVVETVQHVALALGIPAFDHWCETQRQIAVPRKADQDRLDAVICALIGHHWLTADRDASIMVGDVASGYIVAPCSPGVRQRLQTAAQRRGVAIDGRVPAE